MTAYLLDDVRVFFDSADLALSLTKFEASTSTVEKDVTTFRTGTPESSTANAAKLVVGGLESTAIKMDGNSAAGSTAAEDMPDDLLYGAVKLGQVVPVTFGPAGAATGSVAVFGNALVTKISTLGSPGDVWSYSCEATGESMQRGVFLDSVTASGVSGVGTVSELGAVALGQQLHLSVHVIQNPDEGGTIAFDVESDALATFLSPTTLLSVGAWGGNGGSIRRTDGDAITDTFYRLKWTVSGGTGGAYVFVAAAAIY